MTPPDTAGSAGQDHISNSAATSDDWDKRVAALWEHCPWGSICTDERAQKPCDFDSTRHDHWVGSNV